MTGIFAACLGTLDPAQMLTALVTELATTNDHRVALVLKPSENRRTIVAFAGDSPSIRTHETLSDEQFTALVAGSTEPPLDAVRFDSLPHRQPLEHGGANVALLLTDQTEPLPVDVLAAAAAVAQQARLLLCVPSESPALREAKLEAMAEFVAGAGHEINNPLATIVGRVQMLLRNEGDPQRRRMLSLIGGQAYRIRDMIGDAMLFARPPVPQRETVDPVPITRAAIEAARQDTGGAVEIRFDAVEHARIDADPVQLRIVVQELLRNALYAATAAEGAVHVQWSPAEDPPGWQLQVAGPSGKLSESEREHLFDPFFSGRQAGRGLGFGLSKCWRILMLHGGTIEAIPSDGELEIVCRWPA